LSHWQRTLGRCSASQALACSVVSPTQIKNFLATPEAIVSVCRQVQQADSKIDEAKVVLAMRNLGAVWDQLFQNEKHRIVNLMIERIDMVEGGIKIRWCSLGWKALIAEFAPGRTGAELLAAVETL
jgi:hypothetical protein